MRIFGPNFPGVERALEALGTVLSTTSAIEPAILLSVTFGKITDMGASSCFGAVARLPRVTSIQIGVTEGSTSGDVDRFLKFCSQVQPDSASWPLPELERLVVCDADPNLIVEAVRLRYRGLVGGRRTSANNHRKQLEAKPLKLLTAYWKNRVAGEYESLRGPVVRVLGANRVLWWYDFGMKGVWQ
ncbi:hypothetical protein M407DRAFT_132681 [Tulasnella calospora MUT 4182]|uniref:Uncharacterized protein n=1 Tax=Tulasnella calospora MUT 4182 TaxID=1051891 RepID=A0A0C3PZG5_9AGAM|nr:hypothetical protein M407DRAFT_132681 [Tulasnella calospora MUT 4182]